MIYVLGLISVVSSVFAFVMAWKLKDTVPISRLEAVMKGEAEQRKELNDRLMAMVDQDGLRLSRYKATSEPEPAEVAYVDEEREVELERSTNGSSEET